MNVTGTESVSIALSPGCECLAERCRGLCVPLMIVDSQGRQADPVNPPGHQLADHLLATPMFAQALQKALMAGRCAHDEPFELWEGCWILALPMCDARHADALGVMVFLTERFLATDHYRLVCDQARLDAQAVARQARRQALMSDAEVRRLTAMIRWMAQDIERQAHHDTEVEVLSNQLGETYEELSLIYKIATKMTVTQEPAHFLDEACTDLQQGLGVKWLALQLSDTHDRLNQLKGLTLQAGQIDVEKTTLRAIGRELIQRFKHNDATIIDPVASLNMPDLQAIARQLLIVPLQREDQIFGLIFGADKIQGGDLSSIDSKLAHSVAQNLGIFLDNAMLYEDQHDMFMGTLKGMVNAIDAKDTYTCGHSERVAMLSRLLAEAAGLNDQICQRVYLSALVHDVGKIGVPEAVLTKPGRLTDEEFEIIKAHPSIGVRILQDIRQMQDLLSGVHYHHERYDGRGYPEGLAGDSIPLFGRLIALADSFDAMSSDRTYRRALPLDHVLGEIQRCAGTQFDPHLADIFTQLDFAWFKTVIQEHRQRTSPLRKVMG